jgi:HEAT repeat protein
MPKKDLTSKQAKFVKGIAEGKPNYVAALEAYDTDQPEVANAIAVENLQKPSIQEAIELARVKLNITPERVLKPIDDALNDDDVKTRLMGTDRALKLMGIGKNKDDPNVTNFVQIYNDMRDKYT